jgi:hypothetical protein
MEGTLKGDYAPAQTIAIVGAMAALSLKAELPGRASPV